LKGFQDPFDLFLRVKVEENDGAQIKPSIPPSANKKAAKEVINISIKKLTFSYLNFFSNFSPPIYSQLHLTCGTEISLVQHNSYLYNAHYNKARPTRAALTKLGGAVPSVLSMGSIRLARVFDFSNQMPSEFILFQMWIWVL
jgi:hypothetical protein